jgi:hypothetical protein
MRRLLAPALVALLLGAAPAAARDYAPGTALNIIPSGQPGAIPAPAGADTQAKMYDSLTPLFDQVTAGDLTRAFKPATLGGTLPCPCRTESVPRKGVTIRRDAFGVPHITGRTADDVTWATGWVTQEDRGLLLEQGRYAARFAALDAPGINAFSLVTGLKTVTVTRQADRIIEREGTAGLRASGPEGRALLHDVDVYVAGVNARLRRERSKAKPWTRTDVYAVNALAGQIFGQGGGDEARRSMLLDGLRRKLGVTAAQPVFDDLSEHLDADTPTTISTPFPYAPAGGPGNGNAVIDNGSMTPRTLRNAAASTRAQRYASNFLMVSAQRSATGHPLFVAGPQIGYYYPGLTLEMDLKGPGFQARGAAIPAGIGNILIGRGPDFAWSLTSAGSDTNDQFAETLCGGSRTRYRYKGHCRSMGRVNAGRIGGQGAVIYRTTVHGPVLGYATVHGRRVAISFARSSHGRDMSWQLMFKRFTRNVVTSPRTFFAAAARSAFTFNVAYADDRHIAMYSAGRLPRRAPGVDPRLPTKGTGAYEWRGFLPARAHPQQADPAGGTLVNWNNKPAPGFGAADDEWSYGSIQRVQMLQAGLARRQVHDLASVVGAMNAAATQDLRAQGSTLDAVGRVLAGSPPPTPAAGASLALLQAWRGGGSSRLDRDLDGLMDAGAAPVLMDEIYPRIADNVLGGTLGADLLAQLTALTGQSNSPRSGFTGGRLAYVDKDLRRLLGDPLRSPFTTRFCGGGDLGSCRTALWAAIAQGTDAALAKRGVTSLGALTSDAKAERISFAPVGAIGDIRYTNRPSGIQQVISFTGHRAKR